MLRIAVGNTVIDTGSTVFGFDPTDPDCWVMVGIVLKEFCGDKAIECGMDEDEARDTIREN